ncbi:calmodulin [Drosophila subpulchrella]|uniref:calmodulin n=1 Tax=Drosophila subpulchrella TaxID=1486046 RepID=UPI0018A145AD|nr:calmodulin [Drosophila subpulchrella]
MDYDFLTPPPEERIIRTNNLTEEQAKDLEMAFSLFDDQDLKVIPIKHLRQLMRAVGQHPSDLELQDINTEIDADGSGELYLSDFLYIMSQRYENMTTEDEIIAAFRVFDKQGTGFISESEFRHIMKNMGEQMSDDEVEEIIRDADSDHEGNIDYVKFVNMMSTT